MVKGITPSKSWGGSHRQPQRCGYTAGAVHGPEFAGRRGRICGGSRPPLGALGERSSRAEPGCSVTSLSHIAPPLRNNAGGPRLRPARPRRINRGVPHRTWGQYRLPGDRATPSRARRCVTARPSGRRAGLRRFVAAVRADDSCRWDVTFLGGRRTAGRRAVFPARAYSTLPGHVLAPRQQIGHVFLRKRPAEQLLQRSHPPQGMESSQLTGRRKQATERGVALADQRPWMQAAMAHRRVATGLACSALVQAGAPASAVRRAAGPRGAGPDLLLRLALAAAVCQGLALVAER